MYGWYFKSRGYSPSQELGYSKVRDRKFKKTKRRVKRLNQKQRKEVVKKIIRERILEDVIIQGKLKNVIRHDALERRCNSKFPLPWFYISRL